VTTTAGSGGPDGRQTPSARLLETGELPPIARDPSEPVPRKRKKFKPLSFSIKTTAFVIVLFVWVIPLIPNFRDAAEKLLKVNPGLLALGLGLQVAAWFAYALLTKAALGDAGRSISRMRMFRIQMSTKALTNTVPGGSAAGPALGYRLLTLSGVPGPDAGFALATAGLGSAVVLNLIFWLALMISIPIRGVNPGYVTAALVGVVVMLIAVGLVIGLVHGQARAERAIRWIARKLRLNGDKATAVLKQVGMRVEQLLDDRQLLIRVGGWAALNWVLDALSLWVFLRAYGQTMWPDALFVSFGVANVVAAIPITPGGLGPVDAAYIALLPAFGARKVPATLAVASYRLAQQFLPILVGAIFYGTLRIGPWSIERRERLVRMRQLAHEGEEGGESRVEFLMRAWPRRVVRPMPDVELTPDEIAEQERAESIRAIEHLDDRSG